MGYWTHSNPAINDSLATSQAHIQSNFTMIQGVLGSNTLSAGITWAQGDVPYATAVQTIQNLAKATPSAIMTNFGITNNPSWFPIVNISNINLSYAGVFSGTFTGTSSAIQTGILSRSSSIFGTWSIVSTLSATGVLAASDLFIKIYYPGSGEWYFYTDSNVNPITIRGGSDSHNSDCMPVRRGDYWKVTFSSGQGSITQLPIGL